MKHKKEKKLKQNQSVFIEKYLYGENYSDKYDSLRGKQKDETKKAYNLHYLRLTALVAGCAALFCFGYFTMCVMMERNAMPSVLPSDTPPAVSDNTDLPDINQTNIGLQAKLISSDYLDGGVMVESIIRETLNEGYNAVLFDLKRPNGTLAYQSALTSAETFHAVAAPGSKVKESVAMLLENNIIPLARIYCFSDDTATAADPSLAVAAQAGGLWKDREGHAWLNPYQSYAIRYLTEIILEAESLGISNIILDGVELPGEDLSGAVFSGGPNQQAEAAVFNTFVEEVRAKTGQGTRLLCAQNRQATDEAALQTLLAELAAWKEPGTVPVITSPLPAGHVIQTITASGANHYIFAVPPGQEEQTTGTESQG